MPSSLFRNVASQPSQQPNPQLQSAIQMCKSGGNPQSILQSMISAKNPRVLQAMQLVKSMGGDPKSAFYTLAAQKGVDPDSILSMLK